jgi:hypothetical protein
MPDLRHHFRPESLASCLRCRRIVGVERFGSRPPRLWGPSVWERMTIRTMIPDADAQGFAPHRIDGHIIPHDCTPTPARKPKPTPPAPSLF